MQNIALSNYPLLGAITAREDAFVHIGQGIEVLVPKGAKSGDAWELKLTPFTTPKHLDHTILGHNLFIASNQEILSQIQGNLVVTPNEASATFNIPNTAAKCVQDYRTNMVEAFFNHIFVVRGRTLLWTDLDNVWEWQPHPTNEADFRIIEWESCDATGLARSSDNLYLHFPNAIYEVTYVGKPTIVRITAKVHGIGAVTPRSLVVHNNIQFFIGSDNFYVWSPDVGLNAIGKDVWKKFIAVRGPLNAIWAYVDQRNNEICWVSDSRVWAFNFLEKHWAIYSTDGILDHASSTWTDPTPGIVAGSEWPTIIDKVSVVGLENLWVTENAVVREQRWNDPLTGCISMSIPFLETDDISYEDQHFEKRTDLVLVDAKSQHPWVGLRVRVSGRNFITHGSRWVDCGLWTQRLPQHQLNFPAVSGKVLKFRFELVDCLAWNGLLPNGGLQLNGIHLDIANGEIIMDGRRNDFLGHQFICADGTQSLAEVVAGQRSGFFEINSWGERVILPSEVYGPDK